MKSSRCKMTENSITCLKCNSSATLPQEAMEAYDYISSCIEKTCPFNKDDAWLALPEIAEKALLDGIVEDPDSDMPHPTVESFPSWEE